MRIRQFLWKNNVFFVAKIGWTNQSSMLHARPHWVALGYIMGPMVYSSHVYSHRNWKGMEDITDVVKELNFLFDRVYCGKDYNNPCRHDDVIKWKHYPHYRPFVRGIHRSSLNSPHKTQWRGALMFSLICAWINGSVNNCKAGGLGCHRAHYDFIVMDKEIPDLCNLPTLFNSNGQRNLWAKHYCQASSTLDMNSEVSIIKLLWGSESNNLQKFCPLQWSFTVKSLI